jgi:hypothetical protein
MRCACGYTGFADRVRRRVARDEPRWVLVSRGQVSGGLGFVPLGTSGTPGATLWGRVDIDLYEGTLETRCTSCDRLRSEKPVGGGASLAGWVTGTHVFVLMSDIADTACARLELRGDGVAHDLEIAVVEEDAPEGLVGTIETTTALPFGAVVADVVYRAPLPAGLHGEYRLYLVDRCMRTRTFVTLLQFGGG